MALAKLIDLENVELWLRRILTAVTYARTPQDQLRVNVDNQPVVSQYMNNTVGAISAGTTAPVYFASGSWNIMDAREPAREASETHWVMTRNRWTIT